jgi:uncharacterized RDD family membrane protein YckC
MSQPTDYGYNPYAPPAPDFSGYAPSFDDAVLATRGARFGAKLLDGLLDLALCIPGMIWLFSAMSEPQQSRQLGMYSQSVEPNYGAMIGPIAAMVVPLLALTAYQWYLIATRGQTLGKKWLNIRILRTDGSPVGFVNGVILRNWIMQFLAQIPWIGGIISLVNICFIFGSEQQCLHDKIAGTKVVAVLPDHG